MSFLNSAAALRQAEKSAVDAGIDEYSLMTSAGRQAADIIYRHYRDAVRFVILCGGGNNGGDALVAARFLHERYHCETVIYRVKPLDQLTGCAAFAAAELPESVKVEPWQNFTLAALHPGDVIIDGLLGIGFNGGNLREEIRTLIKTVNDSACPVAALDLPSGINSDTGEPSLDGVINADLTVCFGRLKRGLFYGDGSRLRGRLRLVDIGLAPDGGPGEEVFANTDAVKTVKNPGFDCHKNSRGRVLVWGGSSEYPGAPVLSACGALHCGSGIVRLVSSGICRELAPAAVIVEKISTDAGGIAAVQKFYPAADVLVAGCGWGRGGVPEMLDAVWDFPGRIVLDADALNLATMNIEHWKFHPETVITPHPGEAARLAAALGINPACRKELALELAAKLRCVAVLKGRDTVVASPDGRNIVIAAGNFRLATAGSGDVLTGIIAALASSELPLFEAAALGGYIHGVAGENFSGIPIADQLPEAAGKVLEAIRRNQLF